MTEPQKKGISGVVVGLAVLVIILVGSIGYLYYQWSSLNSTYQSYVSRYSHTNAEYNSLNTTYLSYIITHSHTNAEYDSLNTTYQSYVSTHSHTNAEYDFYVSAHSHTDAEYDSYVSAHSHTNAEYDLLNDIVSLQKSQVLISSQTISQPAGAYTSWNFSASYAGYYSVNVESSTTANTHVEVIYSSHGVNYDERITVGTSGTAVFPVLPSSEIQVRVGNTNWWDSATETVTITYYY